jgi:glycosyltransferase involved in cell wall biosynthesis
LTLKVGLNLTYLVEDSGGSGTYARQLLPSLLAAEPGIELTAWVGTTAPAWLAEEPWAGEVRWIRLPVPGLGTPWHLWYELVGIGLDAGRRRLDVVHGPAYLAPLIHPLVATVATILDVIWLQHPEATDARFRAVMRTLVPLVGRRSTRLIAISEAAREDVCSTLGLDRAKFDVTHLGILPGPASAEADPDELRARLGLGDRPLILCVAAKRPHKNLDGLIRALPLLPADSPGGAARLVLPGSPNDYERELRELAADLGVSDRVVFPGWLSDADLDGLYLAASCFVLPTFQEGFGLPVLEAMAHGLPVACSNIPALTEVAGGAAAFFDPRRPESIAATVGALLDDRELATRLVEAGHARCAEFSWQRTARETLDCYRRAVEGRAWTST